LRTGVIVTRQNFDFQHKVYDAQNPTALTLPLVVLVDGETASSAEIVAGALKDNKRALLVGQKTFGKGSLQRPFPLPLAGHGLRMTVARFFSPAGEPYTDRGVDPHHVVPRRSSESMMTMDDTDPQLDVALREAQRLRGGRR